MTAPTLDPAVEQEVDHALDQLAAVLTGTPPPCQYGCGSAAAWAIRWNHLCWANPLLVCDAHHARLTDKSVHHIFSCGNCKAAIRMLAAWRL